MDIRTAYFAYLLVIGILILLYVREKKRKHGKIKFIVVSVLFLLVLFYVTKRLSLGL
jgi:hypothetical protein